MAFNSFTPKELSAFSTGSVYSVCQDDFGSIWLNTVFGVCRFNGNSVEFVHSPLVTHPFATNGSNLVYARSMNGVWRFDSHRTSGKFLRFPPSLSGSTALLAEGDSLFVAVADRVFLSRCDTLLPYASLPHGCNANCLLRISSGRLLVGTCEGDIVEMDGASTISVHHLYSKISSLFLSPEGVLWAGLLNGGFCSLSTSSLEVEKLWSGVGNTSFKEVRSFASDSRGNLYIGAVNGLFILDSSGSLGEVPVNGLYGQPVCGVYLDREDNLWTGTFYGGVSYAFTSSYPFENMPIPSSMRLIKGFAEDSRNSLWAMTDNNGIFHRPCPDAPWRLVPGSSGVKFQCSFYDSRTDAVWAGDYAGPLVSIDTRSARMQRISIFSPEGNDAAEAIVSISRCGDDLILGGTNGVYVFNPGKESAVRRKVPGLSSRVYDVATSPDGEIWIAGTGLFIYSPSDGVIRPASDVHPAASALDGRICADITFDSGGGLCAAVPGKGVVTIRGDALTVYDVACTGLSTNHTACVVPLPGGEILAGTREGISIIDTSRGFCRNYSRTQGLGFSTARGGTSLVLHDGTIIVGGNDGAVSLDPDKIPHDSPMPSIRFDRFSVNGLPYGSEQTLPCLEDVDLTHSQTNFSVDVASCDYGSVIYTGYEYMLEGFDRGWHRFKLSSPLTFMNMKPGRYTLRARAFRGESGVMDEISLGIRIHPVWYKTIVARAAWVILALSLVLIALYGLYSRTILSAKLRIRERENEESKRFFADLSNRIRTPLNLSIGQMESFFRRHGSRTAGVEDLEDVYSRMKKMRGMVSRFVDSQNENLPLDSEATMETVKDAKFLNAAIGVVERNLFTKVDTMSLASELNVGKTTLTSRLKSICGKTPREFIEDIRLGHAMEMLQEGNLRVSEISERLCFSDPKYFSKRFRIKYGINPSEVRGRML